MRHFSSNKHHFGACPIQFTLALMVDAISENLEGVVAVAFRMIKMRKLPQWVYTQNFSSHLQDANR